mgnify:CR=1 FL=1
MNRRQYLAALGLATGGLAGCTTVGTDGTATRTAVDCPELAPRRIALDGVGSLPGAADLSITVTVERARATGSAPATLSMVLTNEGGDRAIDVTDDSRCHLFDRHRGRSDPHGVWLYREGDAPPARADECWTRSGTPPEYVGFDGYGCGPYSLPAGTSVAMRYEVWDDYATDGYFEPDTYRFETSVSVFDSIDATDSDRRLDWWFDLAVSNTAAPEQL